MSIGAAPVYTDFHGLTALRSEARNTPSEAIEEVASQFESLFVQMMLKSMREATIEGDLFDSSQLDLYQQMFDQQVSLDLSQRGGIGLAETLVTQMKGNQSEAQKLVDLQETGSAESVQPIVSLNNTPEEIKRQVLGLFSARANNTLAANDAAPIVPINAQGRGRVESLASVDNRGLASEGNSDSWLPESPEEFIRNVWDHAVTAAKQIGIDPAVLVAQSALETGWGKKVIQSSKGNSFNLFGIKADGRWTGDSAMVKTLEFKDGLAALEKATFRVYDSLSSSFSDYVDFLKGNPRYQQALENVSDSKDFLVELQNAGYATDPKYAEKIMGILDRSNYSSLINELKNS